MAGNTLTIVKKVTVGTPIKNVSSGAFSVSNLSGVNLTGAVLGSMLIYNPAGNSGFGEFFADSDLSSVYVEVNGGTF